MVVGPRLALFRVSKIRYLSEKNIRAWIDMLELPP
jgi:hypothetical protein